LIKKETSGNKIKDLNIWSYVSFCAYNIPYLSAHWIFAMKYWIVAYKLEEGKRICLVEVVLYFILALNIGISVLLDVAGALALKKLFNITYQMYILI